MCAEHLNSPFGIAWGQVYGLKHRLVAQTAEDFLPQVRWLGATATRLNLYWGQIEPTRGQYVWDALDTFTAQLTAEDDAWLVLATSSTWGTRTPSDLIPSSPAKDHVQYYEFVRAVATRCKGRVKYWQMEFEVGGPFWSGSAKEYVEQLRVFVRAVRSVEPAAQIVLAGFLDDAYDTEIALASSTKRRLSLKYALFELVSFVLKRQRLTFYRYLLRQAADLFDVIDLHLYQDVYTIPATIAYFLRAMAAYGYQRPVFIGEYNGPAFISFPENMAHMSTVMRAMHSLSRSLKTRDAVKVAEFADAERRAMTTLYARMSTLPAQTQMFMEGCPPELEAKRNRINGREIVMRNLLALSAGAQRTFCFNLAPDLAGRPYQALNLMFNKYRLMDYAGGGLTAYLPPADAFRRMALSMADVELVRRLEVPNRPTIQLFDIQRRSGAALLVVWERRDAYAGEDQPPIVFEWPWGNPQAHAVDALGVVIPVEVRRGALRCPLSLTPLFIES